MALFVRPLTPNEKELIINLSEQYHNDIVVSRRLSIILLSYERFKTNDIARKLQLKPVTVVKWIKRFNQEGLGCFEDILRQEPPSAPISVPQHSPVFARAFTSAEALEFQRLLELYQGWPILTKRLQAIILSSQGKTISEIADTLDLSNSFVRLWIKQFNQMGVICLETFRDKTWLTQNRGLAVR